MKEKIIYLIIAILFIGTLIGISIITGKKTEKKDKTFFYCGAYFIIGKKMHYLYSCGVIFLKFVIYYI